jgi:DinB superfamily
MRGIIGSDHAVRRGGMIREEMAMEQRARAELVERYKEGFRVFAEALEGITDSELDARSGPQEWTPREVVHHMADSEMTSAIRLRRLIAEDAPTIQGYDQEEFAQRLFYGERPIEGSLQAVAAARRTTGDILDRLTDDQWARSGTHTESGRYGVEAWLEVYADHAHDHADQIRRARGSAHLG